MERGTPVQTDQFTTTSWRPSVFSVPGSTQRTSHRSNSWTKLRSLTAYAAHSLNCLCDKSLLSASHATANCATVWSLGLFSAEYARSLNLTQSDHSHHSRPYDVFHAQSSYPARMTQEGWGGCSYDLPSHVQGNWGLRVWETQPWSHSRTMTQTPIFCLLRLQIFASL